MELTDEQQLEIDEQSRAYSYAAERLLKDFATKSDIPTDWVVIVSYRLQSPTDLFQVQREGCADAIIYVNADYFVSMLVRDKGWRERNARFKHAALRAIKLASLLSNSGSALITGDLAYAITEERKRVRRALISHSKAYLDPKYFTIGGTLTVTDRLSGRVLTTTIMPKIPIQSQLDSLLHQSSMQMLHDDETAELIDLIEVSNNFTPRELFKSATISVEDRMITTSLDYEGDK